jgi:SRSO17 transposase
MWATGGSYNGPMKWDIATYKEHLPYLTRYLSTLLENIGRQERKVATARYVEGLLLPGRRKFIRPLAERLRVDPQSLHQAIANSPWDDRQVWMRIRQRVIAAFEPVDRWVISERAWVKQGNSSIGVSNQRCGFDGKKMRCQINIEILASDGWFAAPIAARLFLPDNWKSAVSEVPGNSRSQTKPVLALALLQEAVADGLPPRTLVGDSTYGNDENFRATLIRTGLEFFLEIDPEKHKAWDFEAEAMEWNTSLQPHSYSVESIIGKIKPDEWRHCSWVSRDGQSRRTRLAFREVFLDSGSLQVNNLQQLWLVVDWPEESQRPFRCYVANFREVPSEARCLNLSRHRHYAENYQHRFENELDLASFQGRSWKAFHHHLVLSAAAYLFVLSVELRKNRPFWVDVQNDGAIDAAIAAETARLAAVLLRSGNTPLRMPGPRLQSEDTPRATSSSAIWQAGTGVCGG